MKKLVLLSITCCAFLFSCNKPSNNNVTPASYVSDSAVIADFVNVIVLPQYQTLQDKATTLNTAVNTLNTTPNATNLAAAQAAWRDARASWEGCEGFLVGPVEDFNYDPNMDTWPVDYLQLDSFISNSSSFTVATIAGLGQSLRGFHPLEYIIWGKDGSATAASLSSRQKQYMIALSQDILNTVTSLNQSWISPSGNFQQVFLTAGSGSTRYASRKAALLALVAGMSDICDEVGNGKMFDPYTTKDSTKTESPFSHNSMIDFTNNILSAQRVYLCSYNNVSGKSISDLVSAKNLSLDNNIKTKFSAALNALDNVSVTFESAIWTQRTQVQTAMTAINDLQAVLDGDLKTFINTYVKD